MKSPAPTIRSRPGSKHSLAALTMLAFIATNASAAVPHSDRVKTPANSARAIANASVNARSERDAESTSILTIDASRVETFKTADTGVMGASLLGKWMKLEQIENVKTVGIDGVVYKGTCTQSEVSQAFSFNSQQIGNALRSPILTSHPHLCSRLDFNSVMYLPAEGASSEKANGSHEEIVLAQVEGHPAMKDIDGGLSTMHIVHGVRLKANCETRIRPKMLGIMSETVLDCRIAEGGTGTFTFLVD